MQKAHQLAEYIKKSALRERLKDEQEALRKEIQQTFNTSSDVSNHVMFSLSPHRSMRIGLFVVL